MKGKIGTIGRTGAAGLDCCVPFLTLEDFVIVGYAAIGLGMKDKLESIKWSDAAIIRLALID